MIWLIYCLATRKINCICLAYWTKRYVTAMEDNSLCLLTFAGRVAEYNNWCYVSVCFKHCYACFTEATTKARSHLVWYHIVKSPHHTNTPSHWDALSMCIFATLHGVWGKRVSSYSITSKSLMQFDEFKENCWSSCPFSIEKIDTKSIIIIIVKMSPLDPCLHGNTSKK